MRETDLLGWHRYLSPYWRAGHGFAPFPLPFTPSITDIREWLVEIDPQGTVLMKPLPADGVLRVSLHRILIETGIALSLAQSSWDPRSWFALYRYGGDFTGTAPDLRFYSGVTDKDPRLTAVASEEVATGVTCYLLHEHFGLPHIADVYGCIERGELVYVNPQSRKRPDYFCVDDKQLAVIAESKGATGTRSSITGRIDSEGLIQVKNVTPVNLQLRSSCGRAVIGTHFCVEGQHVRSDTTTIIKDPEGEASHKRNPESDMVLRLAYAKALRFAGQDVLAERLTLRRDLSEPFRNLERIDLPQIKGLSILPLGFTPFGDVIGLNGSTAKPLFSSTTNSVASAVNESLAGWSESRMALGESGYALPNGFVVIHEYDELL